MPDASITPGDRMARDRTFPPRVLRYSELSRMSSSPAHFRAAYEFPTEPTPSMRSGTLVHAVTLEGPEADRIVVWEGGSRTAKGYRDFAAEHDGAFIVTADEMARARFIAAKIRNHPLAGPALEGEKECELAWRRNGIDCAGRLDVLRPHGITELKCSFTAHPEQFARQAIRMAYHAQAAWYRFGANQCGGDIYSIKVIAVELRRQPHAVTVFEFTGKALDEGDRLCTLWLERFAVQLGAQPGGYWPEYAEYVVPLDAPDDVELVYGETDETDLA